MNRSRTSVGLWCVMSGLLLASAAHANEDHPLVSRYPGSTVTAHTVKDFERYTLVTGYAGKGTEFQTKALEGKVTRIVYTNPADRSTLEIFRNYQQALEKAGATVLYTCEEDGCGPAYVRSAWNNVNGLFAASDGDPRYIAGRVAKGESEAHIAVMVGKKRTQVDVVESKKMDEGLVAVDPAALAQGIERDGSVKIYGILFDFDKADIKPESKPALDAIAALLKSQPALSIFVVGHTDGKGSLDHNMKLSQARAKAVVAALTGQYGIAAARLDGHGVGPLAPVATNTTEEGRKQNRRVELVAR